MQEILAKYLPKNSIDQIVKLIVKYRIQLKIVNDRKTRHGDYRQLTNGAHKITVNASLNPYRFLITLIHEIAHLVAFEKYGNAIKPHGTEWKYSFQQLMLPFLQPNIFPEKLLPLLARHFKNPKASSDTDASLSLALKQFDASNDKLYVFELPFGSKFKLYNGKIFKRGIKRIKRFECTELSSGKIYLFQPNAEVKPIDNE